MVGQVNPGHGRKLVAARNCLASGDAAAAEAILRELMVADNPDSDTCELMAIALANQGKIDAAAENFRAALARFPEHAGLWQRYGVTMANHQRYGEARDAFERALAIVPRNTSLLLNLGLVHSFLGDFDSAAGFFRRCLQDQPGNVDAMIYLGSCCNATGNFAEAIELFLRAIGKDSHNAPAMTYLGAAYQHSGDHREAEAWYRRAIASDKMLADAHCNLGRLLLAGERFAEARAELEAAAEIQSDHELAACGLAMIDHHQGSTVRGLDRLQPFLDRDHCAPESLITAARLHRELGRHDEALACLDKMPGEANLPFDSRVQLHFARGRTLDGLGQFADAWAEFVRANELKGAKYNRVAVEHAVDRVIASFAAAKIKELPVATVRSDIPVFVVGLPRTGKSLLEAALSQDPRFKTCGELTVLGELSAEISKSGKSYPEAVALLSPEELDNIANRYLDALAIDQSVHRRAIDTLPGNFLHLGLVRCLFPDAHVIFCEREPKDTAWFCFAKNFSGKSFEFGFSLADIRHYFSCYERMMEHWLSTPGQKILRLAYEDMVSHPREIVSRICTFLGLDPVAGPDLPGFHDHEIGHHRHYLEWMRWPDPTGRDRDQS